MRNPNEPCIYPHQFFQNSSSSLPSSSPETGPSGKLGDTTDGVLNNSGTPLPSKSPSDKEELKEKDFSISVDPSPLKDSSISFVEKVHKPLPRFPHTLKKKCQAHC